MFLFNLSFCNVLVSYRENNYAEVRDNNLYIKNILLLNNSKVISIEFDDIITGICVDAYLTTIYNYKDSTNAYFYENTRILEFSNYCTFDKNKLNIETNRIPRDITYFYFRIRITTDASLKKSILTESIFSIKDDKVIFIKQNEYSKLLYEYATERKKQTILAVFKGKNDFNMDINEFIKSFEISEFMIYSLCMTLGLGFIFSVVSYYIAHLKGRERNKKNKQIEDIRDILK